MEQKKIEINIKKDEAREIAFNYIREHYGSVPFPDEPILSENDWVISILIRFPRVIFDENNKPVKTRFMKFEYDGQIIINSKTGEISKKPTYFEIRTAIQTNLNIIQETVQKALIKTAAKQFSRISYAEHMHTPITDILANLLIKDRIDAQEYVTFLDENQVAKLFSNIKILEKIGLLENNNGLILPGPLLIEVEYLGREEGKKPNELLSDALKVFFERGYEYVDSVHQVLGPHLTLGAFCYRQAIEYEKPIPIYYVDFESAINLAYSSREEKLFKLPRYLCQLEQIGVIDSSTKKGEKTWIAREDIFRDIKNETDILQPIADILS